MSVVKPVIEESWKNVLTPYFNRDSFLQLKNFLIQEKKEHFIYPKGSEIFSAFNHTPFFSVKVIILGQDPYHGQDQAHGLSFSVRKDVKIPPSLKNIYKELSNDLGIPIPVHGNLEKWANQGVLLLNATLTVRAGSPGSHQKQGWEEFTDAVIKELSDKREDLVFLLWGSYAQSKSALIDEKKHLILTAAHPSPFSAHRGFYGSGHFSKTNDFLRSKGKQEIDWQID